MDLRGFIISKRLEVHFFDVVMVIIGIVELDGRNKPC